MPQTIFVSYSHRQGKWVLERLIPCLQAAGLEVLVDRERFRAGRAVATEIEEWQHRAHRHLLVLSPDYLASDYCRQEMDRAVGLDPSFAEGLAVPVLRVDCDVPAKLEPAIYCDLRNDGDPDADPDPVPDPWQALWRGLDVEVEWDAPHWLAVRDEMVRYLGRGESVNLVVQGRAPWRQLLKHLSEEEHFPRLGAVDLDRGAAVTRRALVGEILTVLGRPTAVPAEDGEDLVVLDHQLRSGSRSLLALLHFDHAARRTSYGVDFFSTLRHLVMDQRQLHLLIHSRTPFGELVPRDHPLSAIDLKTVELAGPR